MSRYSPPLRNSGKLSLRSITRFCISDFLPSYRRKSNVALAAALACLVSLSLNSASLAASNAAVDYDDAKKEATDLLSGYLQVDTTVPPGNEAKGAEYLKEIFLKNGIEARTMETAPGRACVYARLKGDGSKRPIILLSHIDVVPAEASDWKYPPFSGEVHDGELWGRGALDMKGMGIIELEAMLLLKRSGAKLTRDIIYIATPDEEVGGEYGAGWFVKNHADLVSGAEFLLNEGFGIESASGKPQYWGVDFAEKSPLWLELKTRGEAGHASMPLPGSATVRLVKALESINRAGPNFKVLPEVEEYFNKIAPLQSAELKKAYENVSDSVDDKKMEPLLMSDILKSSMLRNTISLTVLKAGYKTNVIPAEARAQLDCRLLPGVDEKEFVSWIKGVIKDDQVEVSILEWEKAEPSSIDSDLYRAIKAVAAKENADVPVVPMVVPWFTDSHWFRELGVTAYGFMPFEIDAEHLATMHGKNERIPLSSLGNGVRRMHEILSTVCGN